MNATFLALDRSTMPQMLESLADALHEYLNDSVAVKVFEVKSSFLVHMFLEHMKLAEICGEHHVCVVKVVRLQIIPQGKLRKPLVMLGQRCFENEDYS